MVELDPVRAFHPSNPVDSSLLSPVYDTLSDDDFRRFSKNPYNPATFVARPSSMPLAEFLQRAPRKLRDAIASGAFVQDPTPSLYVYGIRYTPPSDILEALPAPRRRAEYLLLGLVGAVDLSRTPEETMARHESTFADRIDERVRLTEATGMSFAPIMAGYTLPNHAVNNLLEAALGLDRRGMALEGTATPIVRATLDGSEHRLWRLEDPALRSQISDLLAPVRLLILDGHHRYGAARELLRRGRPGVSPLVMLVESRDRALHLLPWHRALRREAVSLESLRNRTGNRFTSVDDLAPRGRSIEALLEELDRMARRHERGFLAVNTAGGARFRGSPSADGGVDFDLLHTYLAEEFHRDPHDFEIFRSPRKAVEATQTPGSPWYGGVAFLLPPLDEEAIEERIFATGRVMAQKSTMFLPKVAEGVLFAPMSLTAPP
ncbi:MAG TPA: DUF1015 family protein [Thermoplasmata archaeon]|nr:DUF1015 family protein [Thermoplasmata archaeon]